MERAQHRHLLEDVEYARASMGCAVSVVDTMLYPLPQYPGFRSGCYNSARINDHAHTLARKIEAQGGIDRRLQRDFESSHRLRFADGLFSGLSCFRFPSLLCHVGRVPLQFCDCNRYNINRYRLFIIIGKLVNNRLGKNRFILYYQLNVRY